MIAYNQTFSLQNIFKFFNDHKTRILVFVAVVCSVTFLTTTVLIKTTSPETLLILDGKNNAGLYFKSLNTANKNLSFNEYIQVIKEDLSSSLIKDLVLYVLILFLLCNLLLTLSTRLGHILWYNKSFTELWGPKSLSLFILIPLLMILFFISLLVILIGSYALLFPALSLILGGVQNLAAGPLGNDIEKTFLLANSLSKIALLILMIFIIRWIFYRGLTFVIYAESNLSFKESLHYSATLLKGKVFKIILYQSIIKVVFDQIPCYILSLVLYNYAPYLTLTNLAFSTIISHLSLYSIYKQLETTVATENQ